MVEGVSKANYAVPEDVLVQVLSNGEIVLLNLVTEGYYGLDSVGADLIGLLQDGVSLADAQQQLLEAYDVDDATLTTDLKRLISELTKHGLLAELAE